jgi:large subunit ribosomal protein L28
MARVCQICGKKPVAGVQYSHSHRQSKKTWKPNIKKVKAVVNGKTKRIYVCTSCLKSGRVTRAL